MGHLRHPLWSKLYYIHCSSKLIEVHVIECLLDERLAFFYESYREWMVYLTWCMCQNTKYKNVPFYFYLFSFYLFNVLLLANTKNISSDEEGPSWVLLCIIQLFMGVWDLNEVYCLKTGLAAWPSCSSKNWLRNSQFWSCHDNFHSTVGQVFGARVTVNNWLSITVMQVALKCFYFHMPYALCICALRPPFITSCTITALQRAEWERKADTRVSRTSGMNPAFTRDRKQSTYPTHSFSKST